MSHDNFQPPEHDDEPEKDDDDRMYGALSDLASIDTYDTNLRDHPKAYEVLDRLMTHAYGEGRKDEAAERDTRERQLADRIKELHGDVATLREQLRTYREREQTMGWNQT